MTHVTSAAARTSTPGGQAAGAGSDPRWAAVTARAAGADGTFVYAVRTTGIFCRPSCPARRPRRENVLFFDTAAAARVAGFRACRRCRPDRADNGRPDPVARAMSLVLAAPATGLTLARLADQVGLSRFQLQRRFKARYGLTPSEVMATSRRRRFRRLLRGGGTVSRAMFDAGYGSSSRVYERSDATLGMTPSHYARGGLGMTIRYAIVDSPLGRLLVAVTARGVCSVALGRSDRELAAELAREFPAATIEQVDDGADTWLSGLVARVADRLGAPPGAPEIPLDLIGTAFQQRVWEALLAIPEGETRSYGAVARSVGRPRAARAVARACAANRLAVVVPCHRVVREDGSLGGYRWGPPTKRALLEAEAARAR